MKISLLYIGKPRDRAANALAAEYAKRIARFCEFEMREVRGEKALDAREKAYKVALDPSGRELTSAGLAALLEKAQNTAVQELLFLVGGADGLSASARGKAQLLLSLSRLTLPHELARVILAEQIYRAFTILKNHPYAR
ncbi:MAG: 23S rRNA (pseudouridine(1915)-N(3))-methyltransferase RlmH [Acidobacteria bacterium]|nr:23S rRNA (pseudouridine(1915)-N(3))-methyltransferase RlmH [Acidobacteriota bacterium]